MNHTKRSIRLLLGESLFAVYNTAIYVFGFYSYSKVPKSLNTDSFVSLFNVILCLKLILVCISMVNLTIIYRFWGNPMRNSRWQTFLPWNRFPSSIPFYLNIILGIALIVKFTPFRNDNCGIYPNEVCHGMQLIALDTYFAFALIPTIFIKYHNNEIETTLIHQENESQNVQNDSNNNKTYNL